MFFRTRISLYVGVVAALSGALCVQGHADTPAQKSARVAIAAQYQKASRAIMRKDVAPLVAMETTDYQSFSPKMGTISREQEMEMMRRIFASTIQIPKMESKILSLTWRGPDAIIMAQNTTVLILSKGGKKQRVETVDTSRDFWSRTKQGWQIRQSVHQSAKTWVNGKRVE